MQCLSCLGNLSLWEPGGPSHQALQNSSHKSNQSDGQLFVDVTGNLTCFSSARWCVSDFSNERHKWKSLCTSTQKLGKFWKHLNQTTLFCGHFGADGSSQEEHWKTKMCHLTSLIATAFWRQARTRKSGSLNISNSLDLAVCLLMSVITLCCVPF